MVEQLTQIFDKGVGTGSFVDIARGAEPAMIEGDATKALRQYRHILPPRKMAAAAAMREHQRRTFAVNFVVEFDSVDPRVRHDWLLDGFGLFGLVGGRAAISIGVRVYVRIEPRFGFADVPAPRPGVRREVERHVPER